MSESSTVITVGFASELFWGNGRSMISAASPGIPATASGSTTAHSASSAGASEERVVVVVRVAVTFFGFLVFLVIVRVERVGPKVLPGSPGFVCSAPLNLTSAKLVSPQGVEVSDHLIQGS